MRFGGNRKNQRGGTLIMMMLLLPLFLIPMVGMAIDGTMCYIVQAKLAAGVDGAALGAGRLLGTGANTNAYYQEIAGEFLNANFPVGFWRSRNLRAVSPNTGTNFATVTTAINKTTITVAAQVDVPLLFMRVLGFTQATVAATGTATRGNTRVVLVLDRSESMNNTDPVSGLNVFTTMMQGAENFVGMFSPGTDEMGLVVFSTSGIVAYPTTHPSDPSPTGAGGPDTNFATSATAGPIFTEMSLVTHGGFTNTAEALHMAYNEIQKAYNRDGMDNRLNAIVLFTDGVPDSITVSPNDMNANVIKASSACSYKPGNNTAAQQMFGIMGALPPGFSGNNNFGATSGVFQIGSTDTVHTLSTWLSDPTLSNSVPYSLGNFLGVPSTYGGSSPPTTGPFKGCAGFGPMFGLTDMASIPAHDIYGTSVTGYKAVTLTNFDPSATGGNNFGAATWNATDNMANTIRAQTTLPPITIYAIGYDGDSGGLDATLLQRVANDPASNNFQTTQPTGMYLNVHTATGLQSAFQAVASDLLRLAH